MPGMAGLLALFTLSVIWIAPAASEKAAPTRPTPSRRFSGRETAR